MSEGIIEHRLFDSDSALGLRLNPDATLSVTVRELRRLYYSGWDAKELGDECENDVTVCEQVCVPDELDECPVCGYGVIGDSLYCPGCGARVVHLLS